MEGARRGAGWNGGGANVRFLARRVLDLSLAKEPGASESGLPYALRTLECAVRDGQSGRRLLLPVRDSASFAIPRPRCGDVSC
jgi:hypothetical protein